jgi:glutamate synthase (NADPH/NADH) small chain
VILGGDTGLPEHRAAPEAAQVTQVELLPTPPQARDPGNPWPTWPYIFHTSSSQDKAASAPSRSAPPTSRASPAAWSRSHGQRVDAPGAPGPDVRIPVDALILALGFTGPDASALSAELGVALDSRGNIAVDAGHATSAPGVYCAGAAHRGTSLLVWAIAEGRELARHVDAALCQAHSAPPARCQDLPFLA